MRKSAIFWFSMEMETQKLRGNLLKVSNRLGRLVMAKNVQSGRVVAASIILFTYSSGTCSWKMSDLPQTNICSFGGNLVTCAKASSLNRT